MGRFELHHGDALDVLRTLPDASAHALVTDPPAGIAFMGAEWDKDKGGREQWIAWLASILVEARRVLVPSARAIVWSLPRTSHWTATAIEDAGFKIVDVAVHLQAQGFPKSKALLKPAAEHWILARAPGPVEPLNIDACRIGTSKQVPGSVGRSTGLGGFGEREGRAGRSTSDSGFDAALGRWPANVTLEHAEGCEPMGTKRVSAAAHAAPSGPTLVGHGFTPRGKNRGDTARHADDEGLETVETWRCVDGCPVAELDAQSGERRATLTGRADPQSMHTNPSDNGGASWFGAGPSNVYADSGGASRFFFCSKAPPSERREHVGANKHPTVKPLDLMRWLCRLITPPGGVVLDPFTGSGTTGVAALQEGFQFVGVEREAEYVELARSRIENALGPLFAAAIGQK